PGRPQEFPQRRPPGGAGPRPGRVRARPRAHAGAGTGTGRPGHRVERLLHRTGRFLVPHGRARRVPVLETGRAGGGPLARAQRRLRRPAQAEPGSRQEVNERRAGGANPPIAMGGLNQALLAGAVGTAVMTPLVAVALLFVVVAAGFVLVNLVAGRFIRPVK